jgi:hypothetical protein
LATTSNNADNTKPAQRVDRGEPAERHGADAAFTFKPDHP